MIDAHAHFFTERAGRSDWQEINARRLDAGRKMGVSVHVASILGTWGFTSPTYFPSQEDLTHANDRLVSLMQEHPGEIAGYCAVNPNYAKHAMDEITRRMDQGMVGIKLAASRRANDPLVDPIAKRAGEIGAPILHHIWQRRRREWPGQEASDAVELAELAARHAGTTFILAHIGGGGEWSHSLRAVQPFENIVVELSGSGVDSGMLEMVVEYVGVPRMMWGSDVTMDTGLAKLRYLQAMDLSDAEMKRITLGTAKEIFRLADF